jgi:hypothetical protein
MILLLGFLLYVKATECDDAMHIFSKLKGRPVDERYQYQSPTECCYESLFACATEGGDFISPPKILEL